MLCLIHAMIKSEEICFRCFIYKCDYSHSQNFERFLISERTRLKDKKVKPETYFWKIVKRFKILMLQILRFNSSRILISFCTHFYIRFRIGRSRKNLNFVINFQSFWFIANWKIPFLNQSSYFGGGVSNLKWFVEDTKLLELSSNRTESGVCGYDGGSSFKYKICDSGRSSSSSSEKKLNYNF